MLVSAVLRAVGWALVVGAPAGFVATCFPLTFQAYTPPAEGMGYAVIFMANMAMCGGLLGATSLYCSWASIVPSNYCWRAAGVGAAISAVTGGITFLCGPRSTWKHTTKISVHAHVDLCDLRGVFVSPID